MKFLMLTFDLPHTLIADIIANEGYEVKMFLTKISKNDAIILLEIETQELLRSILELLSDQRFLLVTYSSAMYHNLISSEFEGKKLLDELNGTIINRISEEDQEESIDFTKINAENIVKMYTSFSEDKKEDYKNFLIENEMYELLNLIKK